MITQVGTKYDSLDSAASGRVENMMLAKARENMSEQSIWPSDA